jgi:hypothetical protein
MAGWGFGSFVAFALLPSTGWVPSVRRPFAGFGPFGGDMHVATWFHHFWNLSSQGHHHCYRWRWHPGSKWHHFCPW